jgi:hypothetical protein
MNLDFKRLETELKTLSAKKEVLLVFEQVLRKELNIVQDLIDDRTKE